eukprot:Plantae.Rhodophyta-Hildenbrandia_rubra.ctg6110.p1 GENE.Plantae.Rhodophyta-Hildenbrandia_rubra.ctg6110~~Plantae.Rhodophyta-Hildenbrandia_rubra.ctg6110.p1  ORF type:complete len:213 (-),score=25.68 Plantae.Rhodophyta-Hildenbrandia_rubra.ctg6110:435-1073(-)
MDFAFVTPLPFGPTTLRPHSFLTKTCTNQTMTTMTMNTSKVSRRDVMIRALVAGGALVVGPLTAQAKSGDAPKISIFGVGGQSSPFTAGIKSGGKTLYKPYNADELQIYGRIINESKDRLDGAAQAIKDKSWEDLRSRMRLEMSDLRKTQMTLMNNLSDKKERSDAEITYQQFKQAIEDLDYAASTKNQDKALKAYTAAQTHLASWRDTVGF